MSENKRVVKNTLILYVRMLVSMIVTLYTSRIILNVLGVNDFGIYNVVAGTVVMFGFLNSAMAASTVRFLTFENKKSDSYALSKLFKLSLTIHVIIATIVLIIGESVGIWFLEEYLNFPVDRLNAVFWIYQFTLFSLIINIIGSPFNASIIANERMSFFASLGIIEVILKLIAVWFLCFSELDKLILYSFLLLIISFFVKIAEVIFSISKFKECSEVSFLWEKDRIIEMGNFAGWNLFGVAAGVGYNQGVNILLNIFFGVTINAARGIAFQVQGAVTNLVTNFQLAAAPVITKSFSKEDFQNTNNLVFSTSKFSIFLLLLITVPILTQTEKILNLWLKNVPDFTIVFTQLIIIEILINSVSGPLHILVQASGNVKWYQILVSGVLLLNLPVSYIFLILGFAPYYTFFIAIFFSIVALLIRLLVLKRNVNFPILLFFKSVLLRVFIVGTFSFLFVYFIFSFTSLYSFNVFANLLISFIVVVFVVYFFGLNREEMNFIKIKLKDRL